MQPEKVRKQTRGQARIALDFHESLCGSKSHAGQRPRKRSAGPETEAGSGDREPVTGSPSVVLIPILNLLLTLFSCRGAHPSDSRVRERSDRIEGPLPATPPF